MPNWCYTSIQITRPASSGGVKPLYDAIEAAMSAESYFKNRFGKNWLGNIAEKLLDINPLDSDYRCRGTLCEYELSEGEEEIQLFTETAWGPMLKMWLALIDKYVPCAELFYTAQESGCGVYMTNDPTYENRYYIDSWSWDIESDHEATEDDVRALGKRLTGKKCDRRTKIDAVISQIYDVCDEICINAWNYDADLSCAS